MIIVVGGGTRNQADYDWGIRSLGSDVLFGKIVSSYYSFEFLYPYRISIWNGITRKKSINI